MSPFCNSGKFDQMAQLALPALQSATSALSPGRRTDHVKIFAHVGRDFSRDIDWIGAGCG
jgi:hypothetical protein